MGDILIHYDGQLALINLLILCFLIFIHRKGFSAYKYKKNSYFLIGVFVIFNSTFAFSEADTYHYEVFYDMMLKKHEVIHVEPFYYYVAEIVPFSYYLWRCVIWGLAFYLYLCCAKRFHIDARGFGLLFSIILLAQFALTRAALGISLFLLSWITLLDRHKKRNWFSIVMGIIGVVCSYYLHKSLPLFILLAFIAYFPLSRKHYILAVLLFPFVCFGFSIILELIFNSGILSIKSQFFIEHYLEKNIAEGNIKGYILRVITYTPFFIVFYILTKYFTNKKNTITYKSRVLYQYSFILFYTALVLEFQELTTIMASRTLHMMCFPLTIVLSEYIHIQNKYSKMFKLALYLFALVALYLISYHIYKWW